MFRLNPDIRNTTLYYAKLFTVGIPLTVGTLAGTVTVFVCLPWYYWAIGLSLCLVAVLVVWHSVAPFCRYLYYRAQYYRSQAEILSQSGCSTYQGALGAGKSSLAGYTLVTIAQNLFVKLITDYHTMAVHVPDWERANDKIQLERWEEVKTAYDYYMSHPERVPCLFSNIPLYVDGRKASVFTVDHLIQKERLPAYTAVFVDEISYMIDKMLFNKRDQNTDNLAALFRFFRHFFGNGCRLIATEQDAGNVFKDLRRVMVSNEYILDQETLLAPALLSRRLERKRRKLVKWALRPKKNHKITRKFVDDYKVLEKRVQSIGFRRYRYITLGNTEHDFVPHTERTVYAPAALNFYYYNRTFERLYKQRNKGPIAAKVFASDTVSPNMERLQANKNTGYAGGRSAYAFGR